MGTVVVDTDTNVIVMRDTTLTVVNGRTVDYVTSRTTCNSKMLTLAARCSNWVSL